MISRRNEYGLTVDYQICASVVLSQNRHVGRSVVLSNLTQGLNRLLTKQRFDQRVYSVKERQKRKFDSLLSTRTHSSHLSQGAVNEVIKPVVNLSDRVLTAAELNLLNKGLNFNISPGILKPLDIIPAVEEALNLLPDGEANVARLQISKVLSNQKPQTSNLSSEEKEALKSLRSDHSIIVTKSDKGNQIVVMNRKDYEQKVEEHIISGPYLLIPDEKRRTVLNKMKALSTQFLRKVKDKLGKSCWFTLNPKTSSASRFYGLPKIHKPSVPLRPIVDYTCSPTYALAKYIARILRPLEKQTIHTIKNSWQLIDKIKDIKIESDECFVSFDITSLFTNVPVSESLQLIQKLLIDDTTLPERTTLTVEEITEATKLCIDSTYFTFKGCLYQQTAGLAMGSPISPIIANIFMQDFEQRMLAGFENSPRIWWRYVDDTLVVIKRNLIGEFLHYLNNFHTNIQFTIEEESSEHEIQFLDCSIRSDESGSIVTGVYRKDTNSNRYLSFYSEHPLNTKKAIASNLYRRAMRLCSSECEKMKEERLITSVLCANGYSKRLLNETKNIATTNKPDKNWISTVVIPYRRNTSEDIRRILNRHNIRVAFKVSNTLHQKLVRLKDPLRTSDKSNCVYKLQCKDCNACYVGQTARQLEVRVKEHERCAKKMPADLKILRKLEKDSAIALHAVFSNHQIDFENPKVLKYGFSTYKQRQLAEAILIQTTPNVVNRAEGSELSSIWQALCCSI